MKKRLLYFITGILLVLFGSIILNYEGVYSIDLFGEIDNYPFSAYAVDKQWNITWDGNIEDWGRDVAVDSSDNVYISGKTNSLGYGNGVAILLKYDNLGMQQWYRIWGGINEDDGRGVAVDSSDNVYIAGSKDIYGVDNKEAFLVKYDGSGTQQWNRTWGGIDGDSGADVAVDSSNNVYMTGSTNSFGEGLYDVFLVKYDSSGTQQWNRTWGGINGDNGDDVTVDSLNNVYITGSTNSFGVVGDEDMLLVKYDSSGTQQWNRTWGGIDWDFGLGVAIDSSGNVYITGITWSFGGGFSDAFLVKYGSSGTQQWNRTWGGGYVDEGWGVVVDSLDNVYITGSKGKSTGGGDIRDAFLVQYNSSGVQQSTVTWGGSDEDVGMGIAVDSSDFIYITGDTESFGSGNNDVFLLKYSLNTNAPQLSAGSVTPSIGNQNTQFKFSVIYTDQDNNAPILVLLYINGTPRDMEKQNTLDDDYTDGCAYQYLTSLSPAANNYSYYFYANDGEFSDSIIVYNDLQVTSQKSQAIPGFNQYFLILIFGIVSSILIKKRIKKNIGN